MTRSLPKISWVPIRKIVATIAAAILTAGPLAIGDSLGWHLPQAIAVLIVGVITPLVGYLTPSPKPQITSGTITPGDGASARTFTVPPEL